MICMTDHSRDSDLLYICFDANVVGAYLRAGRCVYAGYPTKRRAEGSHVGRYDSSLLHVPKSDNIECFKLIFHSSLSVSTDVVKLVMEEHIKFSVSRVDTFPQHIPRMDDRSGLTYNDKYAIHYDFSDIGIVN